MADHSPPDELPNNIVILSLKIDFVLANSAGPDEMLHSAAFHLAGSSLFAKVPILELNVYKGLN